jgi:hypothetical protein
MEIWEPKSPGTLWATPGLLRDFFTFLLLEKEHAFHVPMLDSTPRQAGVWEMEVLTPDISKFSTRWR